MDVSSLNNELVSCRLVESTIIRGHEVGVAEFKNTKLKRDRGELAIICQCDLQTVSTTDAYRCRFKKKFRKQKMEQARQRYAKYWQRIGTQKAIMHIFRKTQRGEFIGQTYGGLIYAQEVAEVLKIPVNQIWQHLDNLFRQEKLDLNGAILTKYVKRFRFPREIQQLFRYIVEEPLGWPNGDAGDGFLMTLERAIHFHTHFKSGKDAFWPHNFPNLDASYLWTFGWFWLDQALDRAAHDDEAAKSLFSLNETDLVRLDILKEKIRALVNSDRFKAIKVARQAEIEAIVGPPTG